MGLNYCIYIVFGIFLPGQKQDQIANCVDTQAEICSCDCYTGTFTIHFQVKPRAATRILNAEESVSSIHIFIFSRA
jgi:hypothetical protein